MKDKDKAGKYSPKDYKYTTGYLFEKQIQNFNYAYDAKLCSHNTNNCANAAGVIALNYWNTYFSNQLLSLNSKYRTTSFNMNNDAAIYFMDIFYEYMNTNWLFGYGGTLPGDCYNGFIRLIEEYGYVAKKSYVYSFSAIKQQIDKNVPVFITSQDYYFTGYYDNFGAVPLPNIQQTPGDYTLTIEYWRTYGLEHSHTFVGFGYAEYTYYDALGDEQQIHLVKIADGWGGERYFNYDISNKMSMAAIKVSKC